MARNWRIAFDWAVGAGSASGEPRPEEPRPHRQQEELREAVHEGAVAGEELVGKGDAKEGGGGAEAEEGEREGALERSAAGDGGDDGRVEEAAGEEAEEEADCEGVAGDAPLEARRGLREKAPSGLEARDEVGEGDERPEDEDGAGDHGGGALEAEERSGELDDAAERSGEGAEDRVGEDAPRCVPELRAERRGAVQVGGAFAPCGLGRGVAARDEEDEGRAHPDAVPEAPEETEREEAEEADRLDQGADAGGGAGASAAGVRSIRQRAVRGRPATLPSSVANQVLFPLLHIGRTASTTCHPSSPPTRL